MNNRIILSIFAFALLLGVCANLASAGYAATGAVQNYTATTAASSFYRSTTPIVGNNVTEIANTNGRLVLYATANVINDPDSSNYNGGTWANDNFTRTLKIYQTGADSYEAYINDSGYSYITAGALSPQNGITEPANGVATMTGNQNVTFDATSFSTNGLANAVDNSSLGTFNMNGNTGSENYYFTNGLTPYFTGVTNVIAGVNGFTYTYVYASPLGMQTWIDTSNTLVAPGDIVTNKLVLYATANVINDPDSSNYNGGTWANDNFTRTLKIYQTGADSYEAYINDSGYSYITAGALSPQNGITEPANGVATMTGNQNVTFDATSFSTNGLANAVDNSSLGTFNMNGNTGSENYYFTNGLTPYFTGVTNVIAGVNGFTYTYVYASPLGMQTWIDTSNTLVAPGDIVTNKLVLYATANVINDPDSSNYNGGTWANDNFTRTLKIYQTGADSYEAYINDSGYSYITAGALSPQNGITEPANGVATMTGNQNVTFDATSFSTNGLANAVDNSSLGTFNMNGNTGSENYYFTNGLTPYFTGVTNVIAGVNGFTYTYVYASPLGMQTWIDTSNTLVAPGDIVTNKLVLYATANVINDPDSSNYNGGTWANDNFTRTLKIYQTGADSYEAYINDSGYSYITAGALSPQNGITEPANGVATMTGNQNVTFDATSFSTNGLANAVDNSSLGTFNMNGNTGSENYYFTNGLTPYFTGVTNVIAGVNGFTYTYVYASPLGMQTWIDTSNTLVAPGDIVTYPTLTGTSGNTTVSLSPGANTIVVFSGGAAWLTLSSNSLSSTTANVVLANVTNNFTGTSTPSSSSLTFTKVFLLDINVTSNSVSSLSLNVTATIPCGTDAIPYIYNSTSGTWTALVYTSNATACTITFSIPADPVIGVFQSAAAPTTTTGGGGVSSGATGAGSPPVTVTSTVSTTTVAPTTPAQTTPSQNSTKNVTPQVVPAPAATTTVAQASTASLLSAGTLGGVEIAFSAMLAAVIIVAAIAAVSIRRRMRRNSNDIKAVKSIKPKK